MPQLHPVGVVPHVHLTPVNRLAMHLALAHARVDDHALIPRLVQVPVHLDTRADGVDVVGRHLGGAVDVVPCEFFE